MVSKISEGVTISVETFYQPDYSNPANNEFMFAYRITIENNNIFPIKLLRRHWHINDSDGSHKEVEGLKSIPGKIINTSAVVTFEVKWGKCMAPTLWKMVIPKSNSGC